MLLPTTGHSNVVEALMILTHRCDWFSMHRKYYFDCITNILGFSVLTRTTKCSRSQFIESLASFPKTLCAAVHGRCIGLGVTILPLFDVVWATKAASFETPYARCGQLPEAFSVLQFASQVSRNAVRILFCVSFFFRKQFCLIHI